MDSDFVAIGIGAALLHRNDGFVGSVLQVRPYLVLVDVYEFCKTLLRHNSILSSSLSCFVFFPRGLLCICQSLALLLP